MHFLLHTLKIFKTKLCFIFLDFIVNNIIQISTSGPTQIISKTITI